MSDELDAKAVGQALQALGRLPPLRPFATEGLDLSLLPREEGLQEKTVPVAQVGQKLISMRNKLRVLEQRVNASELGTDEKLALQAQITRTYGAFAAFAAFFSDDALPASSDAHEPADEGAS